MPHYQCMHFGKDEVRCHKHDAPLHEVVVSCDDFSVMMFVRASRGEPTGRVEEYGATHRPWRLRYVSAR